MRPRRACVADAEQRIKAIVAWENCSETSALFEQAAAAIDAEFAGERTCVRDDVDFTQISDDAEEEDDDSSECEDEYESSFIDDDDASEHNDEDVDWQLEGIHTKDTSKTNCESDDSGASECCSSKSTTTVTDGSDYDSDESEKSGVDTRWQHAH